MYKIWLDGKLVDHDDANVSIASHALHYGSGVFEGIRAYKTDKGPGIFRLQDHLERLAASAKTYRMDLPYTTEDLTEATWQAVEASGLASCYIRPISFRGEGPLGIYPMACPVVVAIMVMEWGAYLGDEAIEFGVRACLSPYRRFSNSMMPSSAKATGQYLNSILAKLDSKERGYEEAILLNEQGFVSEGTGENIFIVKGRRVCTPRLEDSILPGITRKTAIEMLTFLGVEVQEAAISLEDFMQADEIFLTGTAAEITPVRTMDNRQIGGSCLDCEGTGDYRRLGSGALCGTCNGTGDACRGPVTNAVQKLFFDTINGEPTEFAHLLSYR